MTTDEPNIYTGHADDVRDMSICKDVAETLHKHYPGHLWAVSVAPGVVNIKNLLISHSHGMVIHLTQYYADVANKMVIKMGGEFLERAHLKRGANQGDDANVLEGVADKYQPSDGLIR